MLPRLKCGRRVAAQFVSLHTCENHDKTRAKLRGCGESALWSSVRVFYRLDNQLIGDLPMVKIHPEVDLLVSGPPAKSLSAIQALQGITFCKDVQHSFFLRDTRRFNILP